MEIRTRLVNYMKELGDKDLCVAFSGGVDSSVILRAACEAATANGKKVYAVTFETKLHPKADLPQAQKVAKEAGAIHHVIYVNELDNEEMLNNPVNRCYLCKKYLFQNLLTFAAEKGIDTIMEGNNADDLLIYRPGTQAVKELGVLSPLAEPILQRHRCVKLQQIWDFHVPAVHLLLVWQHDCRMVHRFHSNCLQGWMPVNSG